MPLEKKNGQRNLGGYSPWGREESDTTERLHFHFSLSCTGGGNGPGIELGSLALQADSLPAELPGKMSIISQ